MPIKPSDKKDKDAWIYLSIGGLKFYGKEKDIIKKLSAPEPSTVMN